jgi:hypothetical protein
MKRAKKHTTKNKTILLHLPKELHLQYKIQCMKEEVYMTEDLRRYIQEKIAKELNA